MMRWLRAHIRLVLALLVVAAIVLAAVWPESVVVSVARAERGSLLVSLTEEGETRVRERFVVSAPVAGRLQRIELEPGEAVVAGETVVARLEPAASPLLDPRTRRELSVATAAARAAVGQARAEREQQATRVERARVTLERDRELARAGAITRDQIEASEAALATAREALRAAEFTVQRAQSELDLAEARLGTPGGSGRLLSVLAPTSGVVLRRLHESEALVPAGEPLLELGDPARTEIVADLLSSDAVRVAAGAPVVIERWGGDRPLEGRVRRVEPSGFTKVSALGVEEQRVNVIIDWSSAAAPPPALGDGYRVDVAIELWRGDDVLSLPAGALFRRGDDWAAFRVDGDRARLTPVAVGHRTAKQVEVESGLSAGDRVILYPPDTLSDGSRVEVR
jgi:HlyD family secretion protein